MKPLPTPRGIPTSDRYWSITVAGELAECHFRFPSYGRAARLVKLLSGFQSGDGVDKLVDLLDVAGYAIGSCWYHQAFDLSAGLPITDLERGDWRSYGDRVVDEMQEMGASIGDLMVVVNSIIERIGKQLAELGEAQTLAGE